MTDLAARFLTGLLPTPGLALAVSGGGDSMAMMHLAVAVGLRPAVVTVNHGLRPEALAEADMVARVAATCGLRHQTLHWRDWDHSGNLQNEARKARRRLIAEWAVSEGISSVALAHTRDDVAETFLMRLIRGAGVDGLAAMSPRWTEGGVLWQRPLLDVSRAELRAHLARIGAAWVDDPSNVDDRFDRVRVRKAMGGLRALGLTVQRLADVAGTLAEARHALERATDTAATGIMSVKANALCLDLPGFTVETSEVQRRLILRVISHLAPSEYGPRGPAVQALLARLLNGKPAMLAGCRFLPDAKRSCIWAFREARAVAGLVCQPDQWWDGNWRITGPLPEGAQLRALGPGLAQCPDWRATGLPRAALLASPALWLDDRLVAAPLAGFEAAAYSAVSLQPWIGRRNMTLSH